MRFLVFAQRAEARVDLAGLVNTARQHFDASVEVLEERGFDPTRPPEHSAVRLRLSRPSRELDATFTLHARASTDADRQRARRAELAGRAAGMAELAARCATVWEVEPDPGSSELSLHTLCAILASTALGPVLPPDDSTLYGVRGAMLRVEKIRGPSLAR